jgi:hypothetical protein
MARDQHFTDSQTGKVKGELSSKFVKREVPIRSGPLDHRGLWVVDLEQVSEGKSRVGSWKSHGWLTFKHPTREVMI